MNSAKLLFLVTLSFSCVAPAQTTPPTVSCNVTGCSNHGTCNITTGVCACDGGFLTPTPAPNTIYVGPGCTYQQKSQTKATLIHGIFLGLFGGGNFYAGQYAHASGQLILGIAAIALTMGGCSAQGCFPLSWSGCSDDYQTRRTVSGIIFGIAGAVAVADVIWWGIDLARFIRNEIPDENGYPLY